MRNLPRPTIVFVLALLLNACINPTAINQRIVGKGWYQVKPTDTLYSIAWRYGLDYKELASWNNIAVNSTIYPGQRLMLVRPISSTSQSVSIPQDSSTSSSQSSTSNQSTTAGQSTTKSSISTTQATSGGKNPNRWLWPTKGKVLNTFSAKKLDRRGIDIAGKLGQPVHAVADGKVVYSGNGLAGYGNLIIVKHSDTFLSAYAYSQERLVKEGALVKAGKVIAKMGQHKNRNARLHFQIRKNGKPVDPLQYLPKR